MEEEQNLTKKKKKKKNKSKEESSELTIDEKVPTIFPPFFSSFSIDRLLKNIIDEI